MVLAMRSLLLVLACGLSAHALLPCSSSSDDQDSGHELDDRIVSSLSADELRTACKHMPLPSADARAGFKVEVCLLGQQPPCNPTAFEECLTSVDDLSACIIDEAGCEAIEENCVFLQGDDDGQTCNATVDEVYRCDNDLYLRYESFAELSCATEELPDAGWPASCLVVNEKCPGFFDD